MTWTNKKTRISPINRTAKERGEETTTEYVTKEKVNKLLETMVQIIVNKGKETVIGSNEYYIQVGKIIALSEAIPKVERLTAVEIAGDLRPRMAKKVETVDNELTERLTRLYNDLQFAREALTLASLKLDDALNRAYAEIREPKEA